MFGGAANRGMPNVIWQPQQKQAIFMSRPEFVAMYGGAAGGGKSDALVMEVTRQINNPYYQGLVLRKTYPELTELINRSLELYTRAFPGARYNDSKHVWSFPSGAKIYFGSMQHTKDKIKYQGKQFQFIGIDEATHFKQEEFDFLVSRCRARAQGQRCYVRLTANPGGPGHGWIKSKFITPGPYKRTNTVIEYTDDMGKQHRQVRDSIFIPATIFDNKKLLENDPAYIATLASLNEADKNAFLYGNWDTFSGQVFTEWKNDKAHYDDHKYTHVINPLPYGIPQNWKIYRSMDWGYTKPFSVGWYAIAEDSTIYRIREYYGCTGTPDVGVKMNPKEVAQHIKEVENTDVLLKGRKIFGICDPAIYQRTNGESIGYMMEQEGVYFDKGDNTRLAGKMQFHYRLAFDEEGYSKFYVYNTCKHFIRTLPDLVYSEKEVEDIETTQEDHIYDECRYLLMSSPIAPRVNKQAAKAIYSPLDLDINYNADSKYSWAKMLQIG